MSKNKAGSEFRPNEFVVYPAHGVGKITAIETQEIAGIEMELFVISGDADIDRERHEDGDQRGNDPEQHFAHPSYSAAVA